MVDSPCPFAGSTTASVPNVISIFNIGSNKLRFRTDIPMIRIFNSAAAAAQFAVIANGFPRLGSFIVQIAGTLFELGWIGGATTATDLVYIPNGEHLTSRLAGELAPFTEAVPFP